MKTLKKIFSETKLTWKFLIIFSILIGLIVGILNEIPLLKNTSFQDIAIYLDMWIILAIFIISNCKNCKEAVLKTFIFFLVSQPMIYLTELIIDVIFKNVNFIDQFKIYFINYYIGAGWLIWTFLTIPGAAIAYQIKKNNIWSSLILSVATCFLAVVGAIGFIKSTLINFPYHILNSIICLIMAYLLIFIILENKKERIISLIITTVGLIVGIYIGINMFLAPKQGCEIIDFDIKIVEYNVDNENVAKIYLDEEDNFATISSSNDTGKAVVEFIGDNDEKIIYNVISTNKEFILELGN